jgi:ABC-2 type transport system permease protein/lipopolysaccharide transport system permease protein
MIDSISVLLKELYCFRHVLSQLVVQQLILRYRRTMLGYLWTLINPLLMMTVMAVVFSTLFKADLKEFVIFLFAGMIPWNFFNSLVTQSGASFINNEGLIKKIYLPKSIFPLSVAMALLIDSLLSFLALFVIMLVVGASLSPAMIFIPIAYFLLFLFSFGVALVMSIATVFFRDLQHVILIAMQGLFFLSPILYKHDTLTGNLSLLVGLNPIIPFLELFRAPLYYGVWPSSGVIAHASINALLAMAAGLHIFLRQEKNIVFRL